MPTSPEPGCTSRSWSVNTFVVGDWLNRAVSAGMPRIEICIPIAPSVEPIASSSIVCGMRSRSWSFTSAVHITPDEMMILRLLVS